LIEQGSAALRVGDAAGARDCFLRALDGDDPEVLEGLARASYVALAYQDAIAYWERAYAGYRAARDDVGATRIARSLGYAYGSFVGDWAITSGWLARARTILAAYGAETVERGWLDLTIGMFEADRTRRDELFREAMAAARRMGDRDLELVAMAYLGANLVHGDRTEEGMVLLDEALAAVAGQEVDDFVILEEIFCQLFAACEHAGDIARADQWIRVGDAIAGRRNLPTLSAFCRTHYGGVLTAAGRWAEADSALTDAIRLWTLGQRSMLRVGALVRLADLRVRQGRYEEAEQFLTGLDDSAETARPRAAIHLAAGRIALAAEVLDRALSQVDPDSSVAASLLALRIDVQLAAGDLDAAQAAAERLAAYAARHRGPYLLAVAALAKGRVALASGTGDPLQCLRDALDGFARAQMPVEAARSRLELAALLAETQPEVALAEARHALDTFERLQIARDIDAASAVLRRLGVRVQSSRSSGDRSSDRLTAREAEVLDLLGHGLTNPEIATRLFISRKTVEHHVGNILAKLGLRSRAEAAAYASRAAAQPAVE
jgi:ATP/maltotriose-dependent transcriptional regulator MalT